MVDAAVAWAEEVGFREVAAAMAKEVRKAEAEEGMWAMDLAEAEAMESRAWLRAERMAAEGKEKVEAAAGLR